MQVVESSIDIRVQTESKKNNKTSRRKVAERGTILYCDIFRFVCVSVLLLFVLHLEEEITILRSQIQEYKTKLEREEIRCEEVLSRISKVGKLLLVLMLVAI